jgi:hypothetical protein
MKRIFIGFKSLLFRTEAAHVGTGNGKIRMAMVASERDWGGICLRSAAGQAISPNEAAR